MDKEPEVKEELQTAEDIPKPKKWKLFTNKFVISIIVFVLWMMFFDSNNIFSQIGKRNELQKMRKKREYYLSETSNNEKLIYDLLYNKDALERFGREEFLMKRDNEDIFLIIDKEEQN